MFGCRRLYMCHPIKLWGGGEIRPRISPKPNGSTINEHYEHNPFRCTEPLLRAKRIVSLTMPRPQGNPFPAPCSVHGHAAIASSNPLASAAGAEILLRGGNAADAAVAVGAALAVTEPCSNGLGGDLIALAFEASTRDVVAVLGNGKSPTALDPSVFPVSASSAHAVTVPGCVRAWEDISKRFGRLPFKDTLAPAIRIARNGFPVAPRTAAAWNGACAQLREGGGDGLLINDGDCGRAPAAGEVFVNEALASVFVEVAEGGADAFYRGRVAEAICIAVQERGGKLVLEDLARHETRFEKAMSTSYRGVHVHECGPPTHGAAALLALNIAENFDVPSMERGGERALHTLIECVRLAHAETAAYVADPDFSENRSLELLDKAFAKAKAKCIGERRCEVKQGGTLKEGGTVQFCVVDEEGNAFSVVQSNYCGFGTGIVPEGCGFSLNHRGRGFVTIKGHPNCVGPGKRPYHTIIPGLLTDSVGDLRGVFGCMGSFMQPQGHLQLVCGVVDHGLDAQEAVDALRFRVTGPFSACEDMAEDAVLFPEYAGKGVLDALAARGHQVRTEDAAGLFGRAQIILRSTDRGVVSAGSDSRADGIAIALPKMGT